LNVDFFNYKTFEVNFSNLHTESLKTIESTILNQDIDSLKEYVLEVHNSLVSKQEAEQDEDEQFQKYSSDEIEMDDADEEAEEEEKTCIQKQAVYPRSCCFAWSPFGYLITYSSGMPMD